MVWLTIAAMIIYRFGKNQFDMAVAAEAIYSLGIISILLAASIGAVRMLEDSANFSIMAFVEGLPKVKWLFAESVLGIGLSNGLSTIVHIFEVEFGRDGKERLGSGGTLYGDDIDMSKITSEVRTLGEVLTQVQTNAKLLEDNLESVNQRVSDFASKFFDAQKNLEEFTSASAQMTEEMHNTFTLWKNIATLLVSFDGFRLRKE